RSGTCDVGFSGETYADVTSSTPIAYNTANPPADGAALTANGNDPVHTGHTNVNQTYEEANDFTSTAPIASGADGKWDFALIDNNGSASQTYCLRVARSTGAVLNGYTALPDITTAAGIPTTFQQAS